MSNRAGYAIKQMECMHYIENSTLL